MRILYGVQGTGHGHISRARVVLPKLRELADVDVLISGYNYNLNLDGEIAYRVRGVSLAYDKSGSIDIIKTAGKLNLFKLMRDIKTIPVKDYDLVVNDFEPVSAWAAHDAGIPCVAISHQASFLSERSPRPDNRSVIAENLFRYFAPSTAAIGSHYRRYDDFIEPPIIRKQIRSLNPYRGDHVTVYLPAFDYQTIASVLGKIRDTQWHIFAPDCKQAVNRGNVLMHPVCKDRFLESVEGCLGIISATGFETSSEAMYLGKRLLTIPIRNQYEQLCNAVALQDLGASVVKRIDGNFTGSVKDWLNNGEELSLPEISDPDDLAAKILSHAMNKELVNV